MPISSNPIIGAALISSEPTRSIAPIEHDAMEIVRVVHDASLAENSHLAPHEAARITGRAMRQLMLVNRQLHNMTLAVSANSREIGMERSRQAIIRFDNSGEGLLGLRPWSGKQFADLTVAYKHVEVPFAALSARSQKLILRELSNPETAKNLKSLRLDLSGLFDLSDQVLKETIAAVESLGKCNGALRIELDLSSSLLSNHHAKMLANAMMMAHCNIVVLNLQDNRIGKEGVIALADAIANVEHLNLNANRIGIDGGLALAAALGKPNCSVSAIDLADTAIDAKAVIAIAEAIKTVHSKVTSLDLSCNYISSEGMQEIADALGDANCPVIKANFSKTGSGDQTAAALSAALKTGNSRLATLVLRESGIGRHGAAAIADALKSPQCNLTDLDLSGNHVTDRGASALAQALTDANCKLTYLSVKDCYIGAAGKQELLAAAEKRPGRYVSFD